MAKIERDILRQAFVDPIRFALLVDDKFPDYVSLTNGPAGPELDTQRAGKLFDFARRQGWLCDVDNRGKVSDEYEQHGHLSQSDLLVLDFNLNPLDSNDPTIALELLQKLALSENFNLVIIYTAAAPQDVLRDVAFALGAGSKADPAKAEKVETAIEDLGEDLGQVEAELSQTAVDEYLTATGPKKSADALREMLKSRGLAPQLWQPIVLQLAYNKLCKRVRPEVVNKRPPVLEIQSSIGKNGPEWVAAGNVFVAVVSKGEEPNVLLDRLLEALDAWSPRPLQVMLTHARAIIEKTGRLSDEKVLSTSRLQAGWFLRILQGADEKEKKTGIGELYGRLFEDLVKKIEPNLADFGLNIVNVVLEKDPIEGAKDLAGLPQETSALQIYHALNEFASSEPCPDGPMSPGVLFKCLDKTDIYWLCTSPACDLVPGQNRGGWEGQLQPLRSIAAARLKPIRSSTSIASALADATKGRHLYVMEGDKPVVLEVMDAGSRQMDLEIAFLHNDALIQNGEFSGYRITVEDGQPKLEETRFVSVAKLRPEYASRFLTQYGQQKSRIGVDFFPLKKEEESVE